MALITLTIFVALSFTTVQTLFSMLQNLRIDFKLLTIFIEVWDSEMSIVSKTLVRDAAFLNNNKLRLNKHDLPMMSKNQQLYEHVDYFLIKILNFLFHFVQSVQQV